ncbi:MULTISPECIES: phycobilisome linker polypeptide [unclassified Moorena]|uniref:phycobilisome linker polypeptide n=1 Tax=unclassified Moorena TaxID=2683338 RepID=UPI0013C218C7|nr:MULTISPECIES: phycobilisome linker polypeptide [unclassified Moorena]NEO92476.1 rod-capping linker protein [Moorena sp. SIO3G5]NEO09608.1 rod-capping linker protein [Moorena sp. SIO3I8]NEO20494.1 rod-capping linker protein [Moorena sp. SIO4A5]NEP20911.1 rod-capping linker protein [Moorena sp. SIO3I6]NEQ56994.1 rod-capping linker protein [Moorena sp. SIO4A1]
MSGMITDGSSTLSDYSDRTVVLEVTGLCRQDVMRTSNYTTKVPYSCIAEAMKNISRMGGKVTSVHVS